MVKFQAVSFSHKSPTKIPILLLISQTAIQISDEYISFPRFIQSLMIYK